MCTFLSASATVVPLLHHQEHLQNSNDDVPYALCIELVADRFLRRMVRILVVGTTSIILILLVRHRFLHLICCYREQLFANP